MKEGLFNNVDFSLGVNVSKLGLRERNAFKTVLIGLRKLQETGEEQLPIMIRISPDKLFAIDDFAYVMKEIGVDILSSRKEEVRETGKIITFQPVLYENPVPHGNNDFLKTIISSREATDHFIANFLDYEPSKVTSNVNSKSQR